MAATIIPDCVNLHELRNRTAHAHYELFGQACGANRTKEFIAAFEAQNPSDTYFNPREMRLFGDTLDGLKIRKSPLTVRDTFQEKDVLCWVMERPLHRKYPNSREYFCVHTLERMFNISELGTLAKTKINDPWR